MRYPYVFVLGRPGCGKSAFCREFERQILERDQDITFERVDDFPVLWAKLLADDALEEAGKERLYSQPNGEGDYQITSNRIFNDVLKVVNSQVLEIDKPDHMIFIEFARPSYVEAIQNFDRSILDPCLAVYLEVDFDICWERNVARHQAAMDNHGDDHLVPRSEMEKTYLRDDQEAFVQHMRRRGIPVWVVNNEADGEEHLRRQVKELFERLV